MESIHQSVLLGHYGLDGPRIESRRKRDFPHLSRPVLEQTQPPVHWVGGLFPGGKAVGAWRWPPTPSSAEVKERAQLYLYFYHRPVLGWTLPLHCTGIRMDDKGLTSSAIQITGGRIYICVIHKTKKTLSLACQSVSQTTLSDRH